MNDYLIINYHLFLYLYSYCKLNYEKRLLNNKLFQYFNQTFTLDISQNWNLILSKFLKKKEDSITTSHCKKLKILEIFETSNTRIEVYNLSSKTLNQKLNEIFDKGPKFVLQQTNTTKKTTKFKLSIYTIKLAKYQKIILAMEI